jgi:hypothetical protein
MPRRCAARARRRVAARLPRQPGRSDDAHALLNSLQMGFRTLAIEKRSSEVWAVLGAVKTEFGKFGEALEATRKKLEQATKSIESAGVRTRQIERKLKGVEALPVADAQARIQRSSCFCASGAPPTGGSSRPATPAGIWCPMQRPTLLRPKNWQRKSGRMAGWRFRRSIMRTPAIGRTNLAIAC